MKEMFQDIGKAVVWGGRSMSRNRIQMVITNSIYFIDGRNKKHIEF
jgi:hypothetical protein